MSAAQSTLILVTLLLYAYLWANQRVQTAAAAAPTRRPSTRPSRTRKMKRESFKRLPQEVRSIILNVPGRNGYTEILKVR